MALMESTSRVDEMVAQIDDNNIDVLNEVRDTEELLEKLEAENRRNNNPQFPGQKLSNMMEKWGKEHVYSGHQNRKYATELWVSVEEFEAQLKDEIKGHDIVHKDMIRSYEQKIKHL
jgi:hypothetical protein